MTPLRPLPAGPWIALDERDHRPSCVLSLSQAPSSEARWRLRLYALLARGQVELGELVTQAPLGGATRPTRAAALGRGRSGSWGSPPMMGVSLARSRSSRSRARRRRPRPLAGAIYLVSVSPQLRRPRARHCTRAAPAPGW